MSLRHLLRCGTLFLLLTGACAQAEEKPATLTVSGRGAATAQPDRATVTFGAMAQGGNAADAQTQVSQIMSRSVEAITAAGVPATALTTTSITLLPLYRESDNGEPQIAGYRASNRLEVRVDVDKAGAMIDAVIGAGANEIESVVLGLKDETATRRAALADAVRDARNHAEAIAAEMGVRLLAVDEVQEQEFHVPMLRTMTMKSAEIAAPVQAGEVRIEASVMVRYRISGEVPEKNQ